MIKVLIVEDERPIARAISRLVDQHPSFGVIGMESNGETALAFLRANPVDLVITDIQMPVMTGLQLLEAMQREFPDCLAVVLSGYAQFEYARTALQHRAFDYLLKSVTKDNLFRVLDRAEQEWMQNKHTRQRDQLECALSGEAVTGLQGFHVLLIQSGSAKNQWAQQCFGPFCHVFNREHERIILIEADRWEQEQAEAYFRLASQDTPSHIIYSTRAVRPGELNQTVQRLRSSLEQQIHLFRSDLIAEDGTQRLTASKNNSLQKMKPERAAEAILTQRQSDLKEQLIQMLQISKAHGFLRIDVQSYLNAVFSDSRIAQQLPPEQLRQARNATWDVLTVSVTPEECAEKLAAVLGALQKESTAKRDLSEIIDEIAHQLETNYHLHHSAESLAKQYNFVPGYLNKVFKQYKGVRPSEYLFNVRMERAKAMLETMPDVLVKDVAASVGYNDPHYFSNIFKRTTGLWPTELQQKRS